MTASLTVSLAREQLPEHGGRQDVSISVEPGTVQQSLERHVVICLDISGSMRWEVDYTDASDTSKLEQVKKSIEGVFDKLDDRDYLSIVTFTSRANTVVPIENWGEIDRDQLESQIESVEAGGKTDIYGALEHAHEELLSVESKENAARRILLLSDGQHNPASGGNTNPDFERQAEQIDQQGVSIMAAGVGTDYDRHLMKQLADASQGNWRHLETTTDLEQFFSDELDRAGDVVTADPEVEIDLHPQFDAHDFYRRVGQQSQPVTVQRTVDTITVPLGDLVEDETQKVTFELLAPGREAGLEYTVVEAALKHGDEVQAQGTAALEYVTDDTQLPTGKGGAIAPQESHVRAKYEEMITDAETESEFAAIEEKLDEEERDRPDEMDDTFDALREKLDAARNDNRGLLAQPDDDD